MADVFTKVLSKAAVNGQIARLMQELGGSLVCGMLMILCSS
jgi:hypothetical protein